MLSDGVQLVVMQPTPRRLEVRLLVVVLLPVVVVLLVVVDDLVLRHGLLVVETIGSGYASDVSQLCLLRGGLWWLRSLLGLVIVCVRRLIRAIVPRLARVYLLVLLRLLVWRLSSVTLRLVAFSVVFRDDLALVLVGFIARLRSGELLMDLGD